MSVTSTTRVIEWGRERLRIGAWRGDPRTAFLAPLPGAATPSVAFIEHCLGSFVADGYLRVVTGALSSEEQVAFRQAGFEVAEHLHLLSHDLRHLAPAAGTPPLRRAAREDRPALLRVDHLAFEPFWQLDDQGLDEAVAATPRTRLRVAAGPAPGTGLVAYAITGRAGRRGYLQRLAVHPDHQRRGVGTALVADGLRWLRRWRVEQAMVNTQLANDAALALYERVGFRREASGLSVLTRRLDG